MPGGGPAWEKTAAVVVGKYAVCEVLQRGMLAAVLPVELTRVVCVNHLLLTSALHHVWRCCKDREEKRSSIASVFVGVGDRGGAARSNRTHHLA